MHSALRELSPHEIQEVSGAQYAPPIDIGSPQPYPLPPSPVPPTNPGGGGGRPRELLGSLP